MIAAAGKPGYGDGDDGGMKPPGGGSPRIRFKKMKTRVSTPPWTSRRTRFGLQNIDSLSLVARLKCSFNRSQIEVVPFHGRKERDERAAPQETHRAIRTHGQEANQQSPGGAGHAGNRSG